MIKLMKLVVGLGNPGREYQNNRHNAGFMVVDKLASQQFPNYKSQITKKFNAEIIQVGEYLLIKPQTFMNNSGEVVREIVNFYKIGSDELWVIHDDLDIRLGEYKIQRGVGPKVHNGVNSIETAIGRNDFWRVRVGIDNRPMASGQWRTAGEEYVLEDFRSDERVILDQVVEKIVSEVEELIK